MKHMIEDRNAGKGCSRLDIDSGNENRFSDQAYRREFKGSEIRYRQRGLSDWNAIEYDNIYDPPKSGEKELIYCINIGWQIKEKEVRLCWQ